MAEESAAGVLTPDFDETDRPKKSTVSMITDDVKAAGLQIKPTIDNFQMLIGKHYGDHLRLNEMTGKPEYRWQGVWHEWTDTQESKMRSYFERQYSMYSQAKLQDALKIFFSLKYSVMASMSRIAALPVQAM